MDRSEISKLFIPNFPDFYTHKCFEYVWIVKGLKNTLLANNYLTDSCKIFFPHFLVTLVFLVHRII